MADSSALSDDRFRNSLNNHWQAPSPLVPTKRKASCDTTGAHDDDCRCLDCQKVSIPGIESLELGMTRHTYGVLTFVGPLDSSAYQAGCDACQKNPHPAAKLTKGNVWAQKLCGTMTIVPIPDPDQKLSQNLPRLDCGLLDTRQVDGRIDGLPGIVTHERRNLLLTVSGGHLKSNYLFEAHEYSCNKFSCRTCDPIILNLIVGSQRTMSQECKGVSRYTLPPNIAAVARAKLNWSNGAWMQPCYTNNRAAPPASGAHIKKERC